MGNILGQSGDRESEAVETHLLDSDRLRPRAGRLNGGRDITLNIKLLDTWEIEIVSGCRAFMV